MAIAGSSTPNICACAEEEGENESIQARPQGPEVLMPYVSHGPSHDMPYAIAAVSATAQTTTVVTGVTSQVIRVYAVILSGSTTTVVTFQDSVGVFSGGMTIALGVPLILENLGTPWFTTAPGASFQIVNTVATLGGTVYYTIDKYYG